MPSSRRAIVVLMCIVFSSVMLITNADDQLAKIKQHFEEGKAANMVTDGNTILSQACSDNSLASVEYLLTRPDVDFVKLSEGLTLTPLGRACESRNLEVVKQLMQRPNIDVHAAGRDGTPAWYYMGINNDKDTKDIVAFFVNITSTGKGMTPLMYLVSKEIDANSDDAMANLMLSCENLDLHQLDANHKSATEIAINGKSKLLGAMVNAISPSGDQKGLSPLMVAIIDEKLELVENMIPSVSKTRVISATNAAYEGMDVLMIASHLGRYSLVQRLINCTILTENQKVGAVAGAYKGWTALMFAAAAGHEHVVALLIGAGFPINGFASGMTALMIAMENGHINVVKKLMEHQDLNIDALSTHENYVGLTAFHIGTVNGQTRAVEALLSHIDAQSVCNKVISAGHFKNMTLFSVAANTTQWPMISLLSTITKINPNDESHVNGTSVIQRSMINPNDESPVNGTSVLQRAMEADQLLSVQLLIENPDFDVNVYLVEWRSSDRCRAVVDKEIKYRDARRLLERQIASNMIEIKGIEDHMSDNVANGAFVDAQVADWENMYTDVQKQVSGIVERIAVDPTREVLQYQTPVMPKKPKVNAATMSGTDMIATFVVVTLSALI